MEDRVVIYSPTLGYLDGQGDNCDPHSKEYWDWTPEFKGCWQMRRSEAQTKLDRIKKVVGDAYIRIP